MKRNIRIVVEYDGARFSGWQVQANHRTVQGELQRAVQEITGRKTLVVGSGRTDAGVHAEGQVANWHTVSRLSCPKLAQALNAHLPEDVSVRSAEEVPLDFHAQFHAHRKTYRYVILNRPVRCALRRDHTHLVKPKLDEVRMQEGARYLTGTHDFRSFGTEASRKTNTVRTIDEFRVERRGDEVHFRVTGDGFLYNQIRSMVGTLIEIGLGKHAPEWIGEVREARDRRRAGVNVPPRGLTLVGVEYPSRGP